MEQHKKVIAIYARISNDKTHGRAENVATQLLHGRQYAAQHWPGVPVEEYVDNDVSAADPGTHRPDYERLLRDIRAGRVRAIVAADQDRLTRQPSEWEALLVTLDAAGLTEVHGYRDGRTSVAMGQRAFGRFKALMAAEYVEGIKVKVGEKMEALARAGRPPGGTPYGYRHVRNDRGEAELEPIPEQVTILHETAERILAGWPVRQIAEDLTRRGVPTPRGPRDGGRPKWYPSTVRRLFRSPALVGQRVWRGEVVRDAHGQPIRATWEPILDEDTWARVNAALRDRARAHVPKVDQRRRYWLSGIPTCWKCGGRLVGARRHAKGRAWYTYVCRTTGCYGVNVVAEPTEEWVEGILLGWLDDPRFHAAVAAGADAHGGERQALREALAGVEARWKQAGRQYAEGRLPGEVWEAVSETLGAERAKLRAALDALPAPETLVGTLDDLREDWAVMTPEERRQVARLLIGRMVVGPGVRGRRVPASERIEIAPRWSFA